MVAKVRKLVFTENFDRNLEAIRLFLEPKSPKAFQDLLDRLFDDIFPTLSEFSHSGRSFLDHSIGSLEAKKLVKILKGVLRKKDDLRELIFDDYLLLYLVRGKQVFLLSIKHHRQLSFDLTRLWP